MTIDETIRALLARHGMLAAMLCWAWWRQRSLGAWPTLAVALAAGLAIHLALPPTGGIAALLMSLGDAAIAPILLFAMARRQVIPGLRRGQMTIAERDRWIAAHALARPSADRAARRGAARAALPML